MEIITDPNHPRLRRLHLTLVDQVQTTRVKHVAETWFEIARRLTKSPILTLDRKTKVDGTPIKWALFVPFEMLKEEDGAFMNENGFGRTYSRRESNVVQADLLCFDIDNDPKTDRPKLTIAEAKERFAGVAYCLYTSYNHRNTYKHNVDKFRIVFPLAQAVTYEEFRDRKQALKELFPFIDLASLSISQPFYVPMAHPDRARLHQVFDEDGEWFDLLALEATKREEQKVPPSQFVQTGDVHGDLPMIRLKGGATYRADDLYNVLQEGYRNRKGCYSIDRPDNKPGCFVYRQDSGLKFFDPSATPTTRFIKVMKVKRVGPVNPFEHEEDVETTPLWQRTKREASDALSVPVSAATGTPEKPLTEWDPSQFQVRHLDARYLPADLYLDIPDRGITVIRSPKGTGKTELLSKLTQQEAAHDRNVVLLGHRIFLLKNLAARAGLHHYQDGEHGMMTARHATTLDSLTWIDPEKDEPYHTIIIDESEQVLQHLLAKTLKEIGVVFRNLQWLFKHAKRIICLDADLTSDLTIEIIQELRGDKDADNVLGVINDYKIGIDETTGKSTVTKMYDKRFHLLADALTAVDEGKNVFITCNNKHFATTVDAIVREMGKTALLVTADTNDSEEARTFIEDPTEECKKYQVVVASPTLSTGVSIDGTHFDKVCGFFGINPGTYQDADQALSRVRNCGDVSVWVQGHTTEPILRDEVDIYWDAIETERGSTKDLYEEKREMSKGQFLWARLYARIKFLIHQWSVNKDQKFAAMREELGFKIETVPEDDVANSTGVAIYNSFKDLGTDRAKAIFEAQEIDDEDAAKLGRKKQRSHDEQLSLERFRLWELLRDDLTLENIEKALEQELLQSLAKIRNLHTLEDGAIAHYDREDRKNNKDAFTASRHRVMQRNLVNHLCERANINLHALYSGVAAEEEVEVTREMMLDVAKAFDDRKRDFNHYFNLRIKDPTDEKNIKKVWDATFGNSLSLSLVRKKRTVGGERGYHYYIDQEKKDLIFKTMKDESERSERVFNGIMKALKR